MGQDHYVITTSLVNGDSFDSVFVGADKARAFFDDQVSKMVFGRISSVYLYQGFVSEDGRVRHFNDPLDVREG